MTQRLNSKACSGNTPVLQALANSRHRHQLAIAHCVCSWMLKVVMIDYMPHRLTVTRVYYADILRKLLVAVKKKVPRKVDPGIPTFARQCICSQVTCWTSRCSLLECGLKKRNVPPSVLLIRHQMITICFQI